MAAKRVESGTNKIRFIMVDADLSDGNFSELTQAITHALRSPATVIKQRIQLPTRDASVAVEEQADTEETLVDVDGEETVAREPATRRSSSPRQYPKPEVLTDLDLTSGEKPWEQFAKEKNPTETSKKYLLVAAWCHDFRGIKAVTARHVFTCYRAMGWGLDVKDPMQPFRDLHKKSNWGAVKSGAFEINHLGLGQVLKMSGTATQ